MNKIELTYTNWFRKRTITATFPESWSEMNAKQFAALFAKPNDIQFLSTMLGVKKRIIKRLSLLQIYELAGLLDSVRRDKKLSHFLLESIPCPSAGILLSPKPKLEAMSFEQFIYADSYYMAYANGKHDQIYNLVSHLYLTYGAYHIKSANRISKKLKKLPLPLLEGIALNYGLVRQWMCDRYPIVFPKASIENQEPKQSSKGGWPEVFDNIVGDNLLDRDKYAKLPVNVVFKFITKKIKEQRKYGAKI